MRSAFSALLTYLVSHFRSHEALRLENMALRHQLAVYQQTSNGPSSIRLIASSGFACLACGRAGNGHWSSSSPALSLPGRNSDSEITGDA